MMSIRDRTSPGNQNDMTSLSGRSPVSIFLDCNKRKAGNFKVKKSAADTKAVHITKSSFG